jgi:hypothetical protein
VRHALLVGFAVLLGARGVASAEDPAKDEARKKKVEEAKRLLAIDEEAFRTRVNAAIDRGVAWLRSKQRSAGNFPAYGDRLPKNTYDPMDLGVNSLVLLTLAKSGVPAEDKGLDRLLGWCKADYANMKGRKKLMVYSASVFLLAIDAFHAPPPPPPEPPDPAKPKGRYAEPSAGKATPPKRAPCKQPAWAASTTKEIVEFLRKSQEKSGGWRYPGNPMQAPEGDADMSNTQYALLALNVAARCGVDAPPEVYLKALGYLAREQEPDGLATDLWVEDPAWEPGIDVPPRFRVATKAKARGWTYLPGHKEPSTGAMTVGALGSLAIVKERLFEAKQLTPETKARIDRSIVDGLAWMTDAFTVEDNPVVPPAPAMWHYYYLYGLERMASLLGLRHVGKHDWYRAGADHLVGAQEKDGSWRSASRMNRPSDHTESEVVQTCFALLFLRRSTVPPEEPVAPPVVLPPVTGGS